MNDSWGRNLEVPVHCQRADVVARVVQSEVRMRGVDVFYDLFGVCFSGLVWDEFAYTRRRSVPGKLLPPCGEKEEAHATRAAWAQFSGGSFASISGRVADLQHCCGVEEVP